MPSEEQGAKILATWNDSTGEYAVIDRGHQLWPKIYIRLQDVMGEPYWEEVEIAKLETDWRACALAALGWAPEVTDAE